MCQVPPAPATLNLRRFLRHPTKANPYGGDGAKGFDLHNLQRPPDDDHRALLHAAPRRLVSKNYLDSKPESHPCPPRATKLLDPIRSPSLIVVLEADAYLLGRRIHDGSPVPGTIHPALHNFGCG